jgi:hypothetical protein
MFSILSSMKPREQNDADVLTASMYPRSKIKSKKHLCPCRPCQLARRYAPESLPQPIATEFFNLDEMDALACPSDSLIDEEGSDAEN